MSDTIKVKVVKSASSNYWYKNHIGEVFEVRKYDERDYWVNSGFAYSWYIDMDDCEVIEEFDFHKNPWFISIPDSETCKIVQEWLFSKGLYWYGTSRGMERDVKNINAKEIGKYDTDGFTYVSTVGYYREKYDAKEIKINFKKEVSVESVTYPEYEPEKTEAHKQIEVIEAQIAELNKQVNLLKESL